MGGHIQNEERNSKQENQIKTNLAQMTCGVELSNPPNPLQILGSSAGFKNQFGSEKTYSWKLDLKKIRLKPAPGSGVGLSVFIYTPNSKPRAAQITKSLFS